jgi:SAM-dependent methyltransferase
VHDESFRSAQSALSVFVDALKESIMTSQPVSSTPELEDSISEIANSLLEGRSSLRVLEAGCGSATQIKLKGTTHTVGIDISMEQLARNLELQEKILGDIQDYPLPKEEFDVVVCWMVLEHVPRPREALVNLFGAVKPSGLVILGIPSLFSLKGIVTKLTPFSFHRWFYRFMRYTSRPFPTYLRGDIVPKKVVRLAQGSGFSIICCKLVEGGVVQKFGKRFGLADKIFRIVNCTWQSLLLDKCAIIAKKCEPGL